MLKIFVGTDPGMEKAEIALEYSIRSQTSSPIKITWMNYKDGGLWGGWEMGREPGHPYPDKGWATDFTNFRFAIPEAAGFEGRALYMDVDMILTKDIKELFDLPMPKPVLIPIRPDVMLFDCSAFKDKAWWPSIETMKKSGWMLPQYLEVLFKNGMLGLLPLEWNCLDGEDYDPEKTGLIHFTDMNTQPWKPHPQRFEYPPHPRPDMVALWEKNYREGLKALKSGSP